MLTVRFYGSIVTEWKHVMETRRGPRDYTYQIEVSYKEYDMEGDLVATGTEDMTVERYCHMRGTFAYTWDGVSLNRGGKRRFRNTAFLRFDPSQLRQAKKVYEIRHPEYAIVQFRGNL